MGMFLTIQFSSLIVLLFLTFWLMVSIYRHTTEGIDTLTLGSDLLIISLSMLFMQTLLYWTIHAILWPLLLFAVCWLAVGVALVARCWRRAQRRYAGMSTGGVVPGTRIWNTMYKLSVSRGSNGCFGFNVRRKLLPTRMHVFFLYYPLLDLVLYLAAYKPRLLLAIYRRYIGWYPSISMSLPMQLPSLPYQQYILPFLFFTVLFAVAYFGWLRGMARWHGAEHMAIAAAENNDLNNIERYSPVHERCGGSVLFTMTVVVALYLGLDVQFVGMGLLLLLVVLFDARHLSHVNRLGRWLGRVLQRRLTVARPCQWQLRLVRRGMQELRRKSER